MCCSGPVQGEAVVGYKVVSPQHGTTRFDRPALLWRREGCTIASEEPPAGSLRPGVCFGHDYVSNLKRLSPPLAPSSLGRVIQSSSLGPAVPHAFPLASPWSPVSRKAGTPFLGGKPQIPARVDGPSALHMAALPAALLTCADRPAAPGLNSAEDGSAAFSRVFPPAALSP